MGNCGVVAFGEEKLQKIDGRVPSCYGGIKYVSYSEFHELLDEIMWLLDYKEARKAGEEKYGIGETLQELDEHIYGFWIFSVLLHSSS